MAFYYFDTSALMKRYVTEIGADWVTLICQARDSESNERLNSTIVGELAFVEIAAAIARRVKKTKELDEQKGKDAYALFIKHSETEYQLVPLNSARIRSAADLAEKHALRAYDAVQLALAVHANNLLKQEELALIFVTADKTLLQAARDEGLETENPAEHADLDSAD